MFELGAILLFSVVIDSFVCLIMALQMHSHFASTVINAISLNDIVHVFNTLRLGYKLHINAVQQTLCFSITLEYCILSLWEVSSAANCKNTKHQHLLFVCALQCTFKSVSMC